MAKKTDPQQGSTERRELILMTALGLFTKRGYFNTSVHDIQKEAGVSIGSIYHHFRNKQAIAKALYDSLVDGMAAVMTDIMGRYGSTHDRCRAVVAYLFDLTEANPAAMQYMLYAKHREFMPDEKPVCSSRPFEMMKQMVSEGIVAGEIRDYPAYIAATSIFGGAIRMVYLRLDGVLREPLSASLDPVWECAWRSVAA
ncbi:TetR/AcrR family transcriptional regulator [Thiovibrio sp. JS02]